MGGNGVNSATSIAINSLANASGMTPQQMRNAIRRTATQNGMSFNVTLQAVIQNQNQNNQNNQTYQIWAKMSDSQVDVLRRSMGQNGTEAGLLAGSRGNTDPVSFINGRLNPSARQYIGTGKSMIINSALQNGFSKNQILQPYVYDATHWWYNDTKSGRYSIDQIKQTIKYMDKGMKPLSQNINASRMETEAMTLNSFGLGNLIGKWQNMSEKQINRALYDAERDNAGYTSVSWHDNGLKMGTATNKEVMLRYTIRQGTDAIITNNRAESEIVVGRGYTQRITSASKERINGQTKLVVYVEIEPNSRPNVVKV